MMNSNARQMAEQDEAAVMESGVPYTIIRSGLLKNTPGGQQGFSFKEVTFYLGNPCIIFRVLINITCFEQDERERFHHKTEQLLWQLSQCYDSGMDMHTITDISIVVKR